MASKRLILLLDGTWNDADVGSRDTNIVRLRNLIARRLQNAGGDHGGREARKGSDKPGTGIAAAYADTSGTDTLVFYERGVGTGATDLIRGGAFGGGLVNNIRRAYKFLSYWYESGDEVFVFGFSRGAYTARSLVGYLASAGLLKRDDCTAENEGKAWAYYRTSPNDRLPGAWAELTPFVHDRGDFKVDVVGVFDTVGALGVPFKWAWKGNRERYEFHDVNLSSITKVNLHALAIDEHRHPFQAAIWRKPRFKHFASVTEQVWFPGAHADVGGSYIDEERRGPDDIRALDDVTLAWMIARVKKWYPDFPCDAVDLGGLQQAYAAAEQHNSRQGIYRLFSFAWRAMANHDPGARKWRREAAVSRDRHGEPIAEMVHVSALERMGIRTRSGKLKGGYKPRNLVSVLPAIRRAYKLPNMDPGPEVLMVDWSGDPIATDAAGRERIARLLATALGEGRDG